MSGIRAQLRLMSHSLGRLGRQAPLLVDVNEITDKSKVNTC